MDTKDLLLGILGLLLGSSVLVAFISNAVKRELKHKELIAGATKSALRRAEMYYRIRRRTNSKEDLQRIRDEFHDIQQENDYYIALLSIESKWHGNRYQLFLSAIKKESADKIRQAWKSKTFGPSIEIESSECPQVNELTQRFTKDSRRLMNPFSRPFMRLRDSSLVQKALPVSAYDK